MILDPTVMALLLSGSFAMAVVSLGGGFAFHVLRHWDPASGHARQIAMEKVTYLVATAIKLVLVVQMVALILFVHKADRMAVLFTGAMCALGTLRVNAYGMPAFLWQIAVFFAAGLWLIVNAADNAGRHYPFTRLKYGLLLFLAPSILVAGYLTWRYFLALDPNVITSCCSKLFAPDGEGLQADLAAMDPKLALWGLFGGFGLIVTLALWAWRQRWGAAAFGFGGLVYFVFAIVAVISAVSPYIYEAPTHHCPFCILKPEYGFIGYGLYLPLFAAAVLALGLFVLALWPAPRDYLPELRRRLKAMTFLSTAFFTLFILLVLFAIATSHLILLG